MSRPGSVPLLLLLLPLLPLLLTVAAADDYQWLDDVSLPGQRQPSVEKSTARDCANQCEADKCSGFRYESGDKKCHLYSADCRGPAANSAQLSTDLYMARNTCPGSKSCPCGCPGGFRRYGARCLLTLDQPVTNVTEAAERCAALGAHLAVPRSETENEQMILATTHYQTGELALTWLGIEEVGGVWIGADGCGPIKQFFWAETQPDAALIPWDEFHVAYSPTGLIYTVGWHTQAAVLASLIHRPLCQLASCYRPDCQ